MQKASQMGASTYSILWTLWLAKTQQAKRGVIYWLPDSSNVSDFVKTKVDTLVSDNEELSNALGNSRDVASAYNQGLKFLYGVPIYFRGLKSKVGVKAISADAAVYDEFDEADQSQVAQARKRLSASEVKLERELSTPTIPDYAINKEFQLSDQCHYGFKCPKCTSWNFLEDYFPECFQQDKAGNYYHACRRCKGQLDISKGQWFAKHPANKLRGYQLSQLYSPFVSPNEIMLEYQTTEFIGHFYNHVLGRPYLSATDRVTKEMIFELCDPMRKPTTITSNPTAMGVDVGSVLHVTILDIKNKNVVYVGEHKEFEELDTLFLKFNVRTCVIDALPETRKVKETIRRNPSKVWACFYNDNMKGNYAWKEDENIVTVNRTESMDASSLVLMRKERRFYQRDAMIEKFAEHCENTAKVVEVKENGERRYVYKKLGADHFRHSFNYAEIAASRTRNGTAVSTFR